MSINKKTYKFLIGIDEVGRGPLAGPVAVGAFVFLQPEVQKTFRGVRESKQLNETQREWWYERMEVARLQKSVNFFVTFQSARIIDTKGLSYVIKKALTTSLAALTTYHKISPNQAIVLLDGGLKAPPEYTNQKTIIKGDEKEMVIALASICAKVLRDRKMRRLGRNYPGYGFEDNKGYGTRAHYKAINKHGILPIHRKSFL